METIDDEHRLFGLRCVACRQYFRWETLTATVDGSYLEMIKLIGFQRYVEFFVFHEGAVVKVGIADGGIDDISGRFGGGLLWVVNGIPLQAYDILVLVLERQAEVVRS